MGLEGNPVLLGTRVTDALYATTGSESSSYTHALGESIARYLKNSGCPDALARQRLLHSGDLAECIAQISPREL